MIWLATKRWAVEKSSAEPLPRCLWGDCGRVTPLQASYIQLTLLQVSVICFSWKWNTDFCKEQNRKSNSLFSNNSLLEEGSWHYFAFGLTLSFLKVLGNDWQDEVCHDLTSEFNGSVPKLWCISTCSRLPWTSLLFLHVCGTWASPNLPSPELHMFLCREEEIPFLRHTGSLAANLTHKAN